MLNFSNKKLGFEAHPDLKKFSQDLTLKQKGVIFYTMLIALSPDGKKYDKQMHDYLCKQASLIDFNLTLKNEEISSFKNYSLDFAYNILRRFSDKEKKYYAFAYYSLIKSSKIALTQKQIDTYNNIGYNTENRYLKNISFLNFFGIKLINPYLKSNCLNILKLSEPLFKISIILILLIWTILLIQAFTELAISLLTSPGTLIVVSILLISLVNEFKNGINIILKISIILLALLIGSLGIYLIFK